MLAVPLTIVPYSQVQPQMQPQVQPQIHVQVQPQAQPQVQPQVQPQAQPQQPMAIRVRSQQQLVAPSPPQQAPHELANNYFKNLLKKYTPEDIQRCRRWVEDFYNQFEEELQSEVPTDITIDDLFDTLVDTLIEDTQNPRLMAKDPREMQLVRIALNLAYLRKWRVSPDFDKMKQGQSATVHHMPNL